MRAGIHGAGIAIERVLNPAIAPARRFHGVIDTVFTIALGSVCAFALTLGPAPLNTVAASAAFDGINAPVENSLLPNVVTTDSGTMHQRQADQQRIAETSATWTSGAPIAGAVSQSPSAPPAAAPALPLPTPALPNGVPEAALPGQTAAALAIVENYRVASGLAPFVGAATCAGPILHATVEVTPPILLPEGLARQSLAPDPAHASAQATDYGLVSVTVYSCE